jgi:thiol-disulfide isomerase/thioredoxin
MRKLFPALGLFGVILMGASLGAQEENIKVDLVKYDALKEAVLRQRGKVVVVDFWADFCLPCKRNMPHLVELAREYSSKGLVVITVSIDSLEKDPAVKGKLEAFLKRQKATSFMHNFLLDEDPKLFKEKLHFEVVPTVFIFDRRGQWVQFTDTVDPKQVEEQVKKLLAE